MERHTLTLKARPHEVFSALYREPGAVLLETQKPTFVDRHSYIAWEPEEIFQGAVEDLDKDGFFSFISSFRRSHFIAGYIGYEACQWIEKLPSPRGRDLPNPQVFLAAYPRFLVFDHLNNTWSCWSRDRVPRLPVSGPMRQSQGLGKMIGFNQSKATYLNHVRKVLDYIKAGDVYQINYTQRVYFAYSHDLFCLYLRLRRIQPVAYAAFINTGAGVAISGSPELFLRVKDKRVVTKPMKGTRKRSPEPSVDRRLRKELKESAKDRAENTMIVDLMRNDLGRFCTYGSIEVPRPYIVESYDTVYQMISTVRGTVANGAGAEDIIRAAFPPGSITGTPKKRAMEIIYELEPHARGVYCGTIGWFFKDAMALNVAIRTLEINNGQGVLGVGGGIVADSDPELEYEESIIKAQASMMALGIEL